MTRFSVNATRFDPYKYFTFRVQWDGRYVAGVSKVGGLTSATEISEHLEGDGRSALRGSARRVKFEPITFEGGVTHDVEFERWASMVRNHRGRRSAEISLKAARKDLVLERYNEAGHLVSAYKVFRAWVSEFQAQPDLDGNANAVAIQSLTLENEGWTVAPT